MLTHELKRRARVRWCVCWLIPFGRLRVTPIRSQALSACATWRLCDGATRLFVDAAGMFSRAQDWRRSRRRLSPAVVGLDVDADYFELTSVREQAKSFFLWLSPSSSSSSSPQTAHLLLDVWASAVAATDDGERRRAVLMALRRPQFAADLLTYTLHALDDALGRLRDVRAIERRRADAAHWAAVSPAEQQARA